MSILNKVLTNLGYKVWFDDREMETSNDSLTKEHAQGIKESQIFLSCITNNYCKSDNCNREIEYAHAKAKPIIPLIIDKINASDIDEIQITGRDQTSGISFIIALTIYFCFMTPFKSISPQFKFKLILYYRILIIKAHLYQKLKMRQKKSFLKLNFIYAK